MIGCSLRKVYGLLGQALTLSKHNYQEIDGCWVTYDSDYYQTFRIMAPHGEKLRGVYFSLNKRSYVFLHSHELLGDIIHTCIHEDLHGAIDHVYSAQIEDESHHPDYSAIVLDDIEEHNIIRKIAWIEEQELMFADKKDIILEKKFWRQFWRKLKLVKPQTLINKDR